MAALPFPINSLHKEEMEYPENFEHIHGRIKTLLL